MAKITIQNGHCFRKTGVTGGRGEQAFTSTVGGILASKLRALGHDVRVVLADDPIPPNRDIFIALHTDGNVNPNAHGGSVGFPTNSDGKLAQAWKRAHARAGYAWGFKADNYTAALRGYYGFGRATGYRHEFLAEHGHHSNSNEYLWLHSHYEACADAHVAAIGEVVGHPNPPATGVIVSDPTPTSTAVDVTEFLDGRVWTFAADGGVFHEGGAVDLGSLPGLGFKPNAPVVSGLVTPSGMGYILVGEDGGLFHFGDAPRIQPYLPLIQEYNKGFRKVKRGRWADMEGRIITLLSNHGERYHLL